MRLNYELTRAELISAQRVFLWRKRRAFSWGYTALGAVFFLWNIWLLLQRGFKPYLLVGFGFGAFMILCVPLVLPLFSLITWKKAVAQGAHITTLETSEEGVEISNVLARSLLRWAAFSDVLETPALWLLCVSNGVVAVPKRVLTSEQEKSLFRQELLRVPAPKRKNVASGPPLASP